MRIAIAAALTILALVSLPADACAQKLVFITRHAERADGGATSMMAKTDPALSAAGEARAKKLAAMLADAGIEAIYVTEFRRTKDTAGPLAKNLGLTEQVYAAEGIDRLIGDLRGEHANGIVLIVGHSNTIPGIIKALGGPDVKIGDSEYGNLFVIVPGTGTMTRVRFSP